MYAQRLVRIALASCADLPEWEVDDRPLYAALRARGADLAVVPWDDRSFRWRECDGCLIRTTWDYQERREEFIAWAERTSRVTRLFNPLDIIRWNTHKSYLRDLKSSGVATVPTVWLAAGSNCDIRSVLTDRGWKHGFIKPAVGSTARETLLFDGSPNGIVAAERHLARLLPAEDLLVQPFLDSVRTLGEFSAVIIDGEITHTVRKVPAPGDYRVQDDFGATDEPCALSPDERKTALDAVRAAGGDLLYARADFLRDDSGRLLLTELELVEPSLFFRHCPAAADRLANALLARVTA